MYQEAVELLQIEAAEDDTARTRHGTDRWSREPSAVAAGKIAEQVAEYENYLKAAETTDKRVRGMLADSESMLRLLSGPIHQLEDFVPNSSRATLTPKMDREVGKLRQCMNEVSRLESRRRRKIETLRQKAKADDISKPPLSLFWSPHLTPSLAASILAEAGRLERENPLRKVESADFEPLFNSRLEARYSTDKLTLEQESEEQEELVSRLREANASFLAGRRMDSSLKEREDAIQTLENAFMKYNELIGHLDGGRKFYNELTRLLSRYRDECKHFVYRRRVEAGQMEV
jgi:programmed cell death 6-interacting protein